MKPNRISNKELRNFIERLNKKQAKRKIKGYLAICYCHYKLALKSTLAQEYVLIRAGERSMLTEMCSFPKEGKDASN